MKVLFLGTGTSRGVPSIACSCRVCISDNEKNKRLRPSVLITKNGYHLLIDTSSDFRQQMLRHRVEHLDAVLYTHHHVDHILGLDDIRAYTDRQGPITIYGNERTLEALHRTFGYAFEQNNHPGLPRLRAEVLSGPRQFGPLQVEPLEVPHGWLPILAYRIGAFAYLTDVSQVPDAVRPRLKDLKVLALDALRPRPHPTHLSIDQAVEVAQAIGAERTFFVHMTHDVEHEETSAQLPAGISLAYDGLELEI